ncbi:NrsF family protein [Sphingosinicella terrae]|uniref:NrsF family protein n=1 Tax=Sphingosinicella terrae TaxID=2172047 RepID=UPI000E0DEAB3|nr:NrsF family protein [Sphingosinicella terrae]
MRGRSTETVVAQLAREAAPVRPLPSPARRAFGPLAGFALVSALAITGLGGGIDAARLPEAAAALATFILALLAAFSLSVPGASRRWLAAPLAALLLWLAISGAGCLAELTEGPSGWAWSGHPQCFYLLLAGGTLIGVPLFWLLSRARPIDPIPVALLGALAASAGAAFLLTFFHPFPPGIVDLGFHWLAMLGLAGAAALLHRVALRPA